MFGFVRCSSLSQFVVLSMDCSVDSLRKNCEALQSLLVYESDTGLSSDEEDCGKDPSKVVYPVQAEETVVPSCGVLSCEESEIVTPGAESVSKHPFVTVCCADELTSSESKKLTISQPLPLPESIQNMFSSAISCNTEDRPEEHGGKIRSFAHEQGVWATYVYIEHNPETEFLQLVEELINIAKSHSISLSPNEDFHISLSRTLKLRHHWIQPFIETLKARLIIFHRFKVMLQSVEVYVNEENTRTFLGLKVDYGAERLEKVVRKIDKCLEQFKLPSFHQDPSFHLSVAYSVGNIKEKFQDILPDLNIALQTFTEKHPQCKTIWVSNMSCKSGNKFFNIPFK